MALLPQERPLGAGTNLARLELARRTRVEPAPNSLVATPDVQPLLSCDGRLRDHLAQPAEGLAAPAPTNGRALMARLRSGQASIRLRSGFDQASIRLRSGLSSGAAELVGGSATPHPDPDSDPSPHQVRGGGAPLIDDEVTGPTPHLDHRRRDGRGDTSSSPPRGQRPQRPAPAAPASRKLVEAVRPKVLTCPDPNPNPNPNRNPNPSPKQRARPRRHRSRL